MINIHHSIFLIVLTGSLLLCSCKEKEATLPVPQERLIPVLVDIHFAEAAVQNVFGEQKDSLLQIYYQQIYRIHDITEDEVSQSITTIRKNPALLEEVYKVVIEEVSKKEYK